MFQFKLSNLRTSFFKRKLRNNFIPSTNPYDKNFIYSYKKIKINFFTNLTLIRFTSLINLIFSLILSFFNFAPLAGQIFVGIKKKN